MGREIVRRESPELGKCSKLWNPDDSFRVLSEKTGTKKVKGLILHRHLLMEGTAIKNSKQVVLELDAFAKMRSLQLLEISDVQLYGSYDNFPKALRWFHWPRCPLKSMPNDLPLGRLVALEMPYGCLEKVFNGTQHLECLKVLDLSYSRNLLETPNFSMMPSLERLVLENCTSLSKVHESIEHLERLALLNLSYCRNLRKLPTGLKNMDSLKELIVDGIPVEKLFSNTQEVKPWHLSYWRMLLNLIRSSSEISWVSFPKYLVHLSLENCNLSEDNFPRESGTLPSLQILNLSNNPIRSLPNCFSVLPGLQALSVNSCEKLETLNGWFPNFRNLGFADCKLLEKISFNPSSFFCSSCASLVEIAGRFKVEPFESVDVELINNLDLCDCEATTKSDVELYSSWASKTKRMPPQGLHHKYGFCTYLRGNKIPMSYNLKSVGSSISFAMLCGVNSRIQGMSVCSVYTHSDVIYDGRLVIFISNATKHMAWEYDTGFTGISRADEDMMWLSYWKFEDQVLEDGDQINISVVAVPVDDAKERDFLVKEVAVRLVYKEEEAEEKRSTISGESSSNSSSEQIQYPYSYGKPLTRFYSLDCDKCNGSALVACCTEKCDPKVIHPCFIGDCGYCTDWDWVIYPTRVMCVETHPGSFRGPGCCRHSDSYGSYYLAHITERKYGMACQMRRHPHHEATQLVGMLPLSK